MKLGYGARVVISTIAFVAVMAITSGCTQDELQWNGKTYTENVLQEQIENEIELQNPQFDVDVTVDAGDHN